MNRAKLKNYAPQARRDFIQAVTDRAAYYGLTPNKIEPVIEKGEIALIGGRAFPLAVARKRKALEERISRKGFEQIMEAMAYTWFNRLVAIRFMELHGYFDHGYRVLSNPEGKMIPEILEHAQHVDLPGLNKDKVIELKLDGSREDELYRLVLIAQCNALHSAMPFLFEWVNDETELLLPDNLLHSDSLIRKLVNEIDEEDWQEVEIIGWLYQFYISEKKNQVIGKVVKSEDIPAATQLFTPNWIVNYMVQNTLGRQWLTTYPNSSLRQKMEFYIEPTEQTAEVNAQLKAITPDSLDPEKLTLLDPACGSGHILVEAYDVFKEIYLERGYRNRDIPRLILEKNLFGLDIDDRAAEMAGFAVLMKARKDDRRILSDEKPPRMNIMAIQGSEGLDARNITQSLSITQGDVRNNDNITHDDIGQLIALFKHGKTLGSLITIPDTLDVKLTELARLIEENLKRGDLLSQEASRELKQLVMQAMMLARKYDCAVANPPYLGNKVQSVTLKELLKSRFEIGKTDLFSAFILRNREFVNNTGHIGMMTPFTWLFITTYAKLRRTLLLETTVQSAILPEYHAFFDSAFVPICAFIITDAVAPVQHRAAFIDLDNFVGAELQKTMALEAISHSECSYRYNISPHHFLSIPENPFAFKLGSHLLKFIAGNKKVEAYAEVREGINTGDNDKFLRLWHEPSMNRICLPRVDHFDYRVASCKFRWFACNKGGPFRRWYGNNDYLVDWANDGQEIRNFRDENGTLLSRPQNTRYFFRKGATWSGVGLTGFSARYFPCGFTFNSAGRSLFTNDSLLLPLIGALNSKITFQILKVISPTLSFTVGNISNLPFAHFSKLEVSEAVSNCVKTAISIALADWDSFETSWDFQSLPLLSGALKTSTLENAWSNWQVYCISQIKRMQELETENNRIFIEAYGLQDELTAEVPEEQITLARADREGDMKRLISYAIGCMMGRYSLDEPGLIYAHSGNKGFDSSQYKTFPAGQDGIIPVMEADWFSEDASNRIVEFIGVAWPREHLEENLRFIAECLGPNKGEQPRDTIRRYLATGFLKDHLKIYKNRPIYWLFFSGKLRAFQCLVYLHRYNEATLSRVRTEYVIPLQGKIASRLEQLSGDIQKASSTSHRKKMEKERDTLIKQQAELQSFDEKLRHYADMRISLDLDDGVKVNYGKFGDLLAEVKTVTGGSEE